jgi:hypothetical protein
MVANNKKQASLISLSVYDIGLTSLLPTFSLEISLTLLFTKISLLLSKPYSSFSLMTSLIFFKLRFFEFKSELVYVLNFSLSFPFVISKLGCKF